MAKTWVKNIVYCCVLSVLILSGIEVFAQNLPFNRFSIKDGLPNNQVFALDEDTQGFLWVGTYEGLCRFDGHNFKDFSSISPILRNRIAGITAYNDSLFVTSSSGIAIVHKGKADNYPFPEHLKNKFVYVDRAIYHKDKIYLKIKHQKPTVFDINTGNYSENNSKFEKSIDTNKIETWTVYETRNDSLLVRVYSPDNKEIQKYIYYVENDTIYQTDELWTKFPNDFRKTLIPEFHKMIKDKVLPLSQIEINHELEDSKGSIWAGTEQGLYQIPSLAFEYFTPDDGMPNYVWAIAQDLKNNMWFSSWGNGLAKYNGKKFVSCDALNTKKYYMGAAQTNNGFLLPASGEVTEYNNGKWTKLPIPQDQYLYAYNDSAENRQLFAGVKALVVREPDTIKVFPNNEHDAFLFLGIVKDKKGRYWMGNSKGARRFKNDKYVDVDSDEISMETGFRCCDIDNKQNLWFGGNELIVYKYQSADTISFPELSSIAFLKNYKDSLMLVGCELGLGIIDLHKYYAKHNNYFRFIGEDDGFRGESCGQNGCFIDNEGIVWFTTSQYVNKLDIDKLTLNSLQPNLYFKKLKTAKDDLLWKEVSIENANNDSSRILHYPTNNVQIDYDVINLKHSTAIRFRYMLEGQGNKWSELVEDKSITYTNLKPGKYTFNVQALNPLIESEVNTMQLSFTIRPAYWQKNWVHILFALIFLSTLFFILKYYYDNKRKRALIMQNQQHELNNLQVANIKSQLNPHFIFNMLNNIGYDMRQDKENAYYYLAKMSKLIRETMEHSETPVKTLGEELNFVENFLSLQKYRFADRLNYTIEIDENVDTNRDIPKMIIQILVENALIHGIEKLQVEGKLSLFVSENADRLLITVQDNGVGFNTESLEDVSGTGIRNINKILAIYNRYNNDNAKLTILSTLQKGTKAQICIPSVYRFKFSK